MSKTPAFWWRHRLSIPALCLVLPSWIYGRIAGRRLTEKPKGQAGITVICIGNFVVGGTGKTPFALRLAERLREEGHKPAFLLRGYGGTEKGPLLVDLAEHGAQDVGDEALLLAEMAPTVVAADRVAGAEKVGSLDADILIMDDGFQNPALAKDLSIVLIDAKTGVGNGFCIPAGPLRAPLGSQVNKADVLVVVGQGEAAQSAIHLASRRGLPIIHADIVPRPAEVLAEKPLLAFAGIGRPQKFFDSLTELGLKVAKTRSFADHHCYSERDATALLKQAEQDDIQLVTTAKDMARLETARHEIFRWLAAKSEVLEVEMEIQQEDFLMGLISEKHRQRAYRHSVSG